jgi:uncharacterized protein YqeY
MLIDRLRAALIPAIRARDGAAVVALRSAHAANANAEALPVDQRPAAVGSGADVGVGATEMPRRDLTEAQVADIVRAEITDRHTAADDYTRLARPDEATRLRAEATILANLLDAP